MTPVSTCPKCGAPIYMPTGGNGTQLPMAQHTCMCRFNTHPVKELTDEEIKQIFVEESGFDVDTCPIAIMDFARAILRKAQEK